MEETSRTYPTSLLWGEGATVSLHSSHCSNSVQISEHFYISTFHPNWQNIFPFIVLSLLVMLSVIWAVNIGTEVPEYPWDFSLFPSLLQAVQGADSSNFWAFALIWCIETTEEETILADRWCLLFFRMVVAYIAHPFSGLKFSSLVSSSHPIPRHTGWGERCNESLSLVLPSPLFLAGTLWPVGDFGRRELGTRVLQSIWQTHIPGISRQFQPWGMDKPGAGTVHCNELHSLRWKGRQINGVTRPIAPSASALSQQLSGNKIILSLFKPCLPRCGMLPLSRTPPILPAWEPLQKITLMLKAQRC